MQCDIDLYRRTEFGGSWAPRCWNGDRVRPADVLWAKLVLGIVFGSLLLPLLGWLSGPLGRVLRLLLDPVIALPSGGAGGDCSRGGRRPSSSPPTHSWRPRSPMSSRCI